MENVIQTGLMKAWQDFIAGTGTVNTIVEIIGAGMVGGLIAVCAMIGAMKIISSLHLAEGDMVRGLGSFVTKNIATAFRVGITIHIISAMVFAIIYGEIFKLIPPEQVGLIPIAGTGLGFIHGFVMSAFLVETVADFHPLERFQSAGIDEAFAHVIGHCVFGAALGTFYLWTFAGTEVFFTTLLDHAHNLSIIVFLLIFGCYITYKLHQATVSEEQLKKESEGPRLVDPEEAKTANTRFRY